VAVQEVMVQQLEQTAQQTLAEAVVAEVRQVDQVS
jgi:hypothetical protein